MKNTEIKSSNYSIDTFMIDELGLAGGELNVFAAIYSFTKGALGIFCASQEYLGKICALSSSSVKRILASLLKRGYIEKLQHKGHVAYRATRCADAKRADRIPMPPNDAEEELPPREVIEEKNLDVRELLSGSCARPKYEFHSVGREDMVFMTAQQYKELCTLIDEEHLAAYIRRLELLIKNGEFRTHSSYKTIKRWISEDAWV